MEGLCTCSLGAVLLWTTASLATMKQKMMEELLLHKKVVKSLWTTASVMRIQQDVMEALCMHTLVAASL